MNGNKFVVREGHFHIADKDRYVITGWFEGEGIGIDGDGRQDMEEGLPGFEVFLDCERLASEVLCIRDDSVRQKYIKFDSHITEEYVIIAKLPANLSRYSHLYLRLSDGSLLYERRVSQLRRLQGQLNCRITDIQSTGASCVVTGWAASEKPIKINVFDKAKEPMKCEVSHFPKPDVAFEYRESEELSDSGFCVTVPVTGRKKMMLQITDGENSVIREFSAVDRNRVLFYMKKANYFLKRNGLKKACKRAVNELYELAGDTGNYAKWRKKNITPPKDLERQRKEQHTPCPLIYLITPCQEFHPIAGTAASVKKQTYGNWKWVLACSADEKEKMQGRLYADIPKSQVLFVTVDAKDGSQQRIAKAIEEIIGQGQPCPGGSAGQQADAPAWMALLSPSDTLEPDALYHCVKLFGSSPGMDMCYTDEDQISEDGQSYQAPVFKSDFNIDMLRATDYFGHMVLLRMDIAARLGPWNPVYGADAAYDYYLRAAEAAACIGHLPRVVYHVKEAARKERHGGVPILNEHYKRMGIPATAGLSGTPGIYHTVYHWEGTPMVSINIPNKDHIDDLDTCVQSVLAKCKYPNYEIVIIENNSTQESTFAYYKKLQEQDERVRVIYWEDAFNYSKITNFGVSKSKGEYILLLNNDTEVISPDFMEEMLGYCMRGDVGICGARLFYFDGTIQHAGVIVGLGGICGEGFQGFPKENGGYQDRIFCPQDYSAVTAACLMTKKSVFEEVGGMDAEFQVAYNDIDYCLKVRKTGRLVVYNPFAMLHHYEYKSRGTEDTAAKLARYNQEVNLFTTRWADIISAGDPYYNPNLTRRYQDFSLRRIELLK